MAKDRRPIGRKLRRAIDKARLNQDEVASALGVSRATVNAWLNDRAYPMNSIGALEELLSVNLYDDDDDNGGGNAPRDVSTAELVGLVEQLEARVNQLEQERRKGQGNASGERQAL